MASATQEAFESIRIVGGLLGTKILHDVRQFSLPGQDRQVYGVEPGLTFNDEIGRYWIIARSRWREFQQKSQREDITRKSATVNDWLVPLLTRVLGYEISLCQQKKMIGEREFPISHESFSGAVPVVLCGSDIDLDTSDPLFGQEGRKRSPMGLAQEYLNAQDDSLWAIVSNGQVLRLLRDNPAMTRPAYLEVDFARLFEEDNYADFATLWLLLHSSRLAPQENLPEHCWLEQWREKGHDEGERALDKLRYGVADALRQLGTGFLAHPANTDLRHKLSANELSTEAYFQQVLRLVYRFLFLLTAEDRGIALLPANHESHDYRSARALYETGYSISTLRDKARQRRHYDHHTDAWELLGVTFDGYANGQPLLAQPALGGLFGPDQCIDLSNSQIENRYLYSALFNLSYFEHKGILARINYRDMDTEEFGSVYESLLELIPQLHTEGQWRFSFIGDADDETAASGHSRKLTGSYYTPDSLVQQLIKSALEPVIEERMMSNPKNPREALLGITVCDPACGSGHFLLAAARRLATELARIDAGSDQATEIHFRHALRDVVRHCIYGVDLNPMAVELCKTGLWLESIEPGKPLTFLDAHIQTGNATIGLVNSDILENGIPADAFTALAGDDKTVCQALKTRNAKAEVSARHQDLFIEEDVSELSEQLIELEEMPEESLDDVRTKQKLWGQLQTRTELVREELRADCFVIAYLSEKTSEHSETIPLTEDLLLLQNGVKLRPGVEKHVETYSARYKPFHWYLRFPDIMSSGGFDLILGNPPWKPLSPDYKEFFETYEPNIRFMKPVEQEATYDRLLAIHAISAEWNAYCRNLYASVHFMKKSGRYRMFAPGNLGKGDFNIYRMFVESALTLTKDGAIAAQLVPEGLYNGANAAAIRETLFNKWQIKFIAGFENSKSIWFPSIDSRMKFCAYVAQKKGNTYIFDAAFRINSREKLANFSAGHMLRMSTALVEEFSPQAKAIMEFSSQDEVDICEKMYLPYPKFGENLENLPYRHYMTEVHMGNDRSIFSEDPNGYPVFEGRMVDAYDYRAKGYISGRGRAAKWDDLPFDAENKGIKAQWFVPEELIPEKVKSRIKQYRIGFCDVASPTNSRSLIATLLPAFTISGHKVPTITFTKNDPKYILLWLGVANSLVMDFLVRMKVALTMSYTIMDSLPFPRDIDSVPMADQIIQKVYQLTAAGKEMKDFREKLLKDGVVPNETKIITNPEERHVIESEINALVAHNVYGLSRRQMLYILDPKNIEGENCEIETFKALKNRELRQYRTYRTQNLVMDAWDKLEAGELQ